MLFLTLRTEHWREDLTLSLTSAKYLGHSYHLNMINAFLELSYRNNAEMNWEYNKQSGHMFHSTQTPGDSLYGINHSTEEH